MEQIIFGRVENVQRKGRSQEVTFQQQDLQTQELTKKITFWVTFFCPLNKQDLLYGTVLSNPSGLVLQENPIIEGTHHKDGVKMLFTMAMKGRLPYYESERLYEYFKTKSQLMLESSTGPQDIIYRLKDNQGTLVTEAINFMTEQWQLDSQGTIKSVHNDCQIPEKTIEIIFRWWYRNRILRRLYLLGFTKKIIYACVDRNWDVNKLYYQALENPYVVEKIPLEICHSIMNKYGRIISPDIVRCGQIVREVDSQVESFKHTCALVYNLEKKFPDLKQQSTLLESMFGCRFKYGFIYLKFFAEIEDILTTYCKKEHLGETTLDPYMLKTLNQEQQDAMKMSQEEKVSMVTGGPGTGKSTLIGNVVSVLQRRGIPFYVSSFTGKAVARLKEIIPSEAAEYIRTLHRLYYGKTEPVEYLIVDEISMVGVSILAKVLKKLFPEGNGRLLFVGDPDQLQSIDAGNFFTEILKTEIPHVHLTRDCRRKNQGCFYDNIRALSDREFQNFRWEEDCCFLEGNESTIISKVKELATTNTGNEITVLCPYNLAFKDNIQPLPNLNYALRNIFVDAENPSVVDSFGNTWRQGDRIMMTDNRYDINVMNGEEGTIAEVKTGEVLCSFISGTVSIPTFIDSYQTDDEENNKALSTKLLVLSWAITVHKSQGSQWKHVLYYIPKEYQANSFNNFNMFYTGVSRAEETVNCVGAYPFVFEQSWSIPASLRNDNLARRIMDAQREAKLEEGMKMLMV